MSQRKVDTSPSPDSMPGENRWMLPEPLLAILDEHKYVRRLLPLLEAEAKKLKRNESADYECIEDILHYVINFPDSYHHPKEDLIFARMSGLDVNTAKTVSRLQSDHKKMATHALKLHEKVMACQKSRSREEALNLADDLIRYVVAFRDHMELEETKVFDPALASLNETDWDEIDRAIRTINDPVFGDRISERYLGLMQRYLNDFIAVSNSGAFPVRLIESTVSKIEQGVYALGDLRHLSKPLFHILAENAKANMQSLGDLARARDRAAFEGWCRRTCAVNKNDWSRLGGELRAALGSAGSPEDVAATTSGPTTITLHSEKAILSYQGKPYQPSTNPRISWQAVLMNLVGRVTIKQMMGHANLVDLESSKRSKNRSEFVPPGTCVESVDESNFRGVWIRPEEQPISQRTILHLPGGGFFAPATDMHRKLLGKLARLTESRTMLVNYRLLPNHPFPAGLEDGLAAYRFLLDEGVRPEEIVLSGDSAGGCLALALLLAARDEGMALPAACVLFSPLTDLTFSTAARETNRWKDTLLPTRRKMGAYEAYAGNYSCDHPLVSPIYGSFKGFPPMFALVSSTETLLDDTLVVARKARSQGVDVTVEVWENLPHDWPLFSFIPESDAAIQRAAKFINRHIDGTGNLNSRTLPVKG